MSVTADRLAARSRAHNVMRVGIGVAVHEERRKSTRKCSLTPLPLACRYPLRGAGLPDDPAPLFLSLLQRRPVSGGIPQLLLQAGLTGFFTTKLNWNENNDFPFDLFWWEGNDGSKVLAHSFLNPNGGYNGHINPEDVHQTWKNFIGKRIQDETLLAFGWGDGGGGPSEDMLQNYERIKDYPVLPRLQMGKVEEFYDSLTREGLPTYVGEMYLELHRATLTTQALVKQLNRQAEHRLVEAEAFAALARQDAQGTLDAAW